MTEPTITCPNCKTEIKLTELLAAPLIESTRIKFEQQSPPSLSRVFSSSKTQASRIASSNLPPDIGL